MARTRGAQIMLEEEEYERLETIAAQRGISISDLIREAVQDRYTPLKEQRQRAVEAICQLTVPLPDWDDLEREIAAAYGSDIP